MKHKATSAVIDLVNLIVLFPVVQQKFGEVIFWRGKMSCVCVCLDHGTATLAQFYVWVAAFYGVCFYGRKSVYNNIIWDEKVKIANETGLVRNILYCT